jgi:hypothetical protein
MAGHERPFLKKDYLEKLKAVSYRERNKMKEVIDETLGDYQGEENRTSKGKE